MTKITERLVSDMVAATQGIQLGEAAARRVAAVIAAFSAAVDRVAGASLMETEPARFDRYVVQQRNEDV
jgi:hypothetical protein